MTARCALLLCLLPSFLSAHSLLPTRLRFTQQERTLLLEATLDPLALSGALRAQNVVLRLSMASLQEAAPAIELLLDEHLIIEAQQRECPREAPLSFSLVEGGLVQVKTAYQCKDALDELRVRCDLFDDPRDPHSIEAVFQLASGAVPFVFGHENQVFRFPPKAPTPIATADTEVARSSWGWFLFGGSVLSSIFVGVLLRGRRRR